MRPMGIVLAALLLCGCVSPNVDVTKTAKGYYEPTNPNDVEILMTRPDRPYVELGSVLSRGWPPTDQAKLHNALRAKAAPLGANAVILLNHGFMMDGWGNVTMWSTGVAIRWQ